MPSHTKRQHLMLSFWQYHKSHKGGFRCRAIPRGSFRCSAFGDITRVTNVAIGAGPYRQYHMQRLPMLRFWCRAIPAGGFQAQRSVGFSNVARRQFMLNRACCMVERHGVWWALKTIPHAVRALRDFAWHGKSGRLVGHLLPHASKV